MIEHVYIGWLIFLHIAYFTSYDINDINVHCPNIYGFGMPNLNLAFVIN